MIAVEPLDSPDNDSGGKLFRNTVAAVPPDKSSSKRGKPCSSKHTSPPNKQLPSNSQPYICFNHCHWGKEAWECANPKHCRFEGNGKGGALVASAADPSSRPGHLLMFTDSTSNQQFLVDTGSAYSIVPHSSSEPLQGQPSWQPTEHPFSASMRGCSFPDPRGGFPTAL